MTRIGAILLLFAPLFSTVASAQKRLQTGPPSASVNTMLAYPLTLKTFSRYTQASRAMTALINTNPEVLAKLKPSSTDAPKSIDETVSFSTRHCPECVSTVEKSGMSYREYVLFQGSLLIAYVSAIRPHTASKVHVTPENIQFVQTNRTAIEKILAEQRQQPAARTKQ